MKVLIAPAAFKGTLSADEAARAIGVGVHRALPHADVRLLPIADGGDGSVDALIASGFDEHAVDVAGPTGVRHRARIAVRGSTAVVELANTCGIALLPGDAAAPMTSSTHGLGEAMRVALDLGAEFVVICLGGSASTDGGAGMLEALGARLVDAAGRPVEPGGRGLAHVAGIDLAGLDVPARTTRFTVAADVTSPLFGPGGAAHVFGPQKGASADEVAQLDAGLRTWARVLEAATGRDVADVPGAGAAGGTGAAAMAVLHAELVSGAGYVQSAVGLADAVAAADLVVTGEGHLDEQSLLGKGPVAVARIASSAGVPVIAVCGRISLTADQLRDAGFAAWSSVL